MTIEKRESSGKYPKLEVRCQDCESDFEEGYLLYLAPQNTGAFLTVAENRANLHNELFPEHLIYLYIVHRRT